jgi:exopolyphosphatase/guanosine-5'-triphosphate,3'-diphosphate pyrophosphatase
VRDEPAGEIVQLEHLQIGTRLGEGLRAAGSLQPAAVARTLAAVEDFAARARERGALLSSIATSALRRAENAAEFSQRMREVTGVALEILPGRIEAEASFRGATYGSIRSGARVAVVDVGGGSTEVAVGRDGALEDARSIELGSVRLAERYPALGGTEPGAPARAAARAARSDAAAQLAPFALFRGPDHVRAVAGTALTLGAVAYASDVEAVSGLGLSRSTIEAVLERLLDSQLEERRRLPGMLPQRADILAAGAIVLLESLRALEAETVLLERNDLLLGFLLMRREAAARPGQGPREG